MTDLLTNFGIGMTTKFITYPLDRINTLYQIVDINKREINFRSIGTVYHGCQSMMIKHGVYVGTRFWAYDLLNKNKAFNSSFVTGSVAGLVSVFASYPLEKLNTMIVCNKRPETIAEFAKQMYRGAMPSLIGIIFYSGIQFSTYELMMDKVCSTNENKGTASAISGFVAGLTSKITTYPNDVIRKNIQVDSSKSYVQTMRSVMNNRMTFSGLYIYLFRGGLSSAITFALNQLLLKN